MWIVPSSDPQLPLEIEDAARKESHYVTRTCHNPIVWQTRGQRSTYNVTTKCNPPVVWQTRQQRKMHEDNKAAARPAANKKESSSCTTYSNRDQLFPGAVFDSHCHLDFIFRKLKGKVWSLSQCMAKDGEDLGSSFGGCVANFCNPMDWSQGPSGRLISKDIENSKKDSRVFLAIGCHPHFADRMGENSTEQLAVLVSGRSKYLPRGVVALGECGLDYSRKNTVDHILQKQVFYDQ